MRSHSDTCCRSLRETGRARIEPSDNDSALLEAFDDAKRVRPSRRVRQREERRERHARSLFPGISGTLSALLARITNSSAHNRTRVVSLSPSPLFLSISLRPSIYLSISTFISICFSLHLPHTPYISLAITVRLSYTLLPARVPPD